MPIRDDIARLQREIDDLKREVQALKTRDQAFPKLETKDG